MNWTPLKKRLLQDTENEGGMRRPADAPSDNASDKCVDDEGDIDEALPGGQWSKKRGCASPSRTAPAPFSTYDSLFNFGPCPWQHHDSER